MSGKEKIRLHVESLFISAPKTRRALELKEEFISNLDERYQDLIAQGKSEEEASQIVIDGIGDVEELLQGLRENDVLSPASIQQQRKKSALLISVAVGLYIISFIFPAFFSISGFHQLGESLGVALMFICWGVATGLLIYNGMSKPKYVKAEETVVEDFKEWSQEKKAGKAVYKSIQSIVWLLAVVGFFLLMWFAHAYAVAWLIFILAAIINQIIKLIFTYKGEE